MVSTVKIVLDNYINNVCYPGQTLSGRVECFFNKEKTVRAIRLQFKGKAKTKWTRKHGKSSTTYSAEDIYFNQEYNLVAGQGGDDIHIEGGRHSYPFSYILPQGLPSSFESKYGKIKYKIKATVDRPWKFDYEETLILNVYSPLDLNTIPEIEQPYAISVEKQVSSGCCSSDPLTFNISLPATGFAVGQDMNIGAYVSNMSNVNIDGVQFRIFKVLEWIAKSTFTTNSRTKEIPITTCVEGVIGAHAEKSWTSTITIPSDNYANLIPCSIINATYHLEARVVLPFPHSDLSYTFPIVIGTVPLSGINMGFRNLPPPVNPTAPPDLASSALLSTAAVDIGYPPEV